jgi:hypothetical protein
VFFLILRDRTHWIEYRLGHPLSLAAGAYTLPQRENVWKQLSPPANRLTAAATLSQDLVALANSRSRVSCEPVVSATSRYVAAILSCCFNSAIELSLAAAEMRCDW